jgi:hypothetical protein
MASLAMRAASLLLMLVAVLCFATTGSAASASSYKMIAGVNGTSYFWTVVSELMANNTALKTKLNAAIQDDLQTAAGTDVTVTYTDMLINASAMYLEYIAAVAGSTPTEAELQSRVAADASFPKLTAAITGIDGVQDIADLIPASLSVTTPLYADPNAADSASDCTMMSSVNYDVVLLFSGAPSVWVKVLSSSCRRVSADIVAAVQSLMNSSQLVNNVTVGSMDVLAADSDKKTMGSGAGGLLVRLHIVSSGTAAMRGRYLSTMEYASSLLLLNTTALSATFQAFSSSSATVVVEEATSAAALGARDKCDNSCKYMIAMAAVVGFLAAVCVVTTVVTIVCPCACLRVRREPLLESQKGEKEFKVETEVEVISVDGDDQPMESHLPNTIPHLRRQNTEPIME